MHTDQPQPEQQHASPDCCCDANFETCQCALQCADDCLLCVYCNCTIVVVRLGSFDRDQRPMHIPNTPSVN